MALKDSFETRRQNEQKYQVRQCAKQGCIYLGPPYPYHVWLVEENRNTLNQNPRYNSEILRPSDLTPSFTRIYQRDHFGPLGRLIDFETPKQTRLGMKLFKDINPNLPLAEQIQKKYGLSHNLFNEFAVVNPADNISVYSRETETPAVEADNTTSSETADRYTLDQSHQSYFSRRQISHNRMLVLGDRQKEIQLAHMFDNKILVIDGGPGTGKTSTMIQRLKLLLSNSFYNDDDYQESDFSNGTSLARLKDIWNNFLRDKADKSNTWMFFSPTIQLNNFLKSSLSGEGLKYIEESTKVWVNRSKKNLTGYCIELARDFYHFIDNTTLQHEKEGEYFTTPPQSLYRNFETKLLNQYKEDHIKKLDDLRRLEKGVGIEHPKNFISSPSSLAEVFKYSGLKCCNTFDDIDQNSQKSKDFIRHLSDELTNELYENCLGLFQNESRCSIYKQKETSPSEDLRNKILTRIILFRFVEKNNLEIFNDVFDIDSDILKKYQRLCGLLNQTRLSDFKAGFCSTPKKDCDPNAPQEESKQSHTSYCDNNPYKDKFKDPTATTMDIFLKKMAEETGYPLSAKAYHTLFYAIKGSISRKPSDGLHGLWSEYFTEEMESDLTAATEKLIWVLIKRFVNYGSKAIGYEFQGSWFVTNEISKAWADIANVEKARKDLYKKEDIDILFGDTFRNVYDAFRQDNNFAGSLKIQELSFMIFAANTLAQKLYKANNDLFLQLSAQNSILDAYNSATRIIIGIDESTDFTPIELAAMASLGHPEYNCVTLAGDQLQAFNEKGITNWNQLNDGIFSNPCAIMDLKISYRQSHTLLEMAKKIYKRAMKKDAPYESYVTLEQEASPLLIKSDDRTEKIRWLVDRINSIQRKAGYQPATAIFYPSDDKSEIEEFADELQSYITVDSCFSTTDNKIIVYPLSLVKGLEFEVAFFYDLDSIKSTEMQQRYLYVGLSRATFYLGATSSSHWNDDLSNDFKTDIQEANWPTPV